MKKSVSKKLEASRRKSSRLWSAYRTKKKHILSLKRMPLDLKRGMVAEQREVTKENISTAWSDYRGWKFGAIHHSKYDNFSYIKKTITTNTEQQWYKASKFYNENNLDAQVGSILNEPGVVGVLVIIEGADVENDLRKFGSNFITKVNFERIHEGGDTLFENVAEKLRYSKSMPEYEFKNLYIRVIYEKSKKIKS